MRNSDIEGPIFISVGTPEKLSLFLNENPQVPRDSAFVDSSENFEAYEAAGFGNIGDITPTVGLVKPELTAGQWLSYFGNVGKVAPKELDGVKRLGGSFVVRDSSLIYSHSDSIPGDDAPVEEVLKAAESTA